MKSYSSSPSKFLLRHSSVLYTAIFALLYDHNKQQQRNYEGWIPCKTHLLDKTKKKYVLVHLGYFWLIMLRVLTETFQVFMMFWWFQSYSLNVSERKEAGRKEQGVKRRRMKEQWGAGWVWAHSCPSSGPAALHFQQLCSKKEVAPSNASVTEVRCEVQGVNMHKYRQYMAWAWAINQRSCRGCGFMPRFQKQPFTCSSPTQICSFI